MNRFVKVTVISAAVVAILVGVMVGAAVWLGFDLSGDLPVIPPETPPADVSLMDVGGSAEADVRGIQKAENESVLVVDAKGPVGGAPEIPDLTPQSGEHPMQRTLDWAKSQLSRVEAISDYSATFTKRESVDGSLGEPTRMFMKMRHRPCGIYVRYEVPAKNAGVEAIYIEPSGTQPGKGKMWGHGVGLERILGTLSLDPNGMIAMQGQKYPITTIGILKMHQLFVEIGTKDMEHGECGVVYTPEMMWNGRRCAEVVVTHPVKRDYFRFHRAIVRIDRELVLPLFYQAFDWATDDDGNPKLIEEFYYENVKLNNGFTDADFNTKNKEYNFP